MIKKLICRLFGHVHVEEMYAAPVAYNKHKYVIIKEVNCARCGESINFQMTDYTSASKSISLFQFRSVS